MRISYNFLQNALQKFYPDEIGDNCLNFDNNITAVSRFEIYPVNFFDPKYFVKNRVLLYIVWHVTREHDTTRHGLALYMLRVSICYKMWYDSVEMYKSNFRSYQSHLKYESNFQSGHLVNYENFVISKSHVVGPPNPPIFDIPNKISHV